MQQVEESEEAGSELSSPTEYLDLMSFKRTSFRLQLLQTYRVRSERAAFEQFIREGTYDVPLDDPRLARQREHLCGGRVLQRVQVVVPPVSDYLRFSFGYFRHFAEAGEDIRILEASRYSAIGLPDHDFVLLDDEVVIKLRHSSEDGQPTSREPLVNVDVAKFRGYRDRALEAAIPFDEYVARLSN
ncbi:hypothetical protein SAMN04489729_6954 [Amycolatopsis lurida]|uniref:DUF6879 domain-containing protein n=1 Tax=Amycolatopsis lurida NRRL 2430 TaxID=1460371 RepID=A0A2P2FGG6_AMYLU|nr:DUF6879 family protein [Amycolatopsis lurida]KFU75816.1 hypothetical protein BB31_39670 [Amycolatopsis lurida NRRL 2430]SEE28618.1 hypothetical protein SAMN04489729_6954 [Amycolatopsis lurida]